MSTLLGKSLQRGLKFQCGIVCLLDPGSGIDSPDCWLVLSDNQLDVTAPDVSTRAHMSKHLDCGPLALARTCPQLSRCQAGGKRGEARRCFREHGQNLLNGE